MSKPSKYSTNLVLQNVNSISFSIDWTNGNGDNRIVAVTEVDYNETPKIYLPINGEKYNANIHYGEGDRLVGILPAGYPLENNYPYPCTPNTDGKIEEFNSKTHVVYKGNNVFDGVNILNLKPQKDYYVNIFEYSDDFCYLIPTDLKSFKVTTSSKINTEVVTIIVYDNRTRLGLKNASVKLKDYQGYIAETGTTNDKGIFNTKGLEEGRYSISVVHDSYEPKELRGVFIQREEPRRDTRYRDWLPTGVTEMRGSSERQRLRNKNNYRIYLDGKDGYSQNYNKYTPNRNPSKNTKI